MACGKVYAGALAPEAMRFRLITGESGLDLSLALSATLTVARPDKSLATWQWLAVDFTSATSDEIVLQRLFVDGDVPHAGEYRVKTVLVFPDGARRLPPAIFKVDIY